MNQRQNQSKMPAMTGYQQKDEPSMSYGKRMFILSLILSAIVSSIWLFTELPELYWTPGTGMYCIVHHGFLIIAACQLWFSR